MEHCGNNTKLKGGNNTKLKGVYDMVASMTGLLRTYGCTEKDDRQVRDGVLYSFKNMTNFLTRDAEKIDDIPPLHAAVITRVHSIFGALLFYARAVNDKILVALIELSQHQAATTETTHDTVTQLLDYVATYPSNGITFHARDMALTAHSDASYLNVSKDHSRAGAHIMLSEKILNP